MFKGGLADQGEVSLKYHTATHLLQAALRKVLGDHIGQKGSNITGERLRFDFSHPKALTPEEKKEVEDQINEWIKADLPVTKEMMSKQDALKSGAIAFFIEKYPETVSVYTVGMDPKTDWVSKELCGGPHVEHTGSIGPVTIFKEEAVSAGVRRIYIKLAA
jgi:alanyl-tRNA synthetase